MKNIFSLTIVTVAFVGLVTIETVEAHTPTLKELARRVAALERNQVPKGVIAYFASTCPRGWSTFNELVGRYAVGVGGVNEIGNQIGEALATAENRAAGDHTHIHSDAMILDRNFALSKAPTVTIPGNQGISGQFVGGANVALALDSGKSTKGIQGAKQGTNAPYLQLIPCAKN